MLEGRRGGERRRHAPSSACTRRRHERSSHAHRGRVLHSVRTPVHVNPHYRPDASRTVGRTSRHHGWANRETGRTITGADSDGRSAARRVSPLSRGRRRGTSEKEGGRGLRPCEDRRARVSCPHVEVQLQKSVGDVWPRISSAYALQKERSGSSERGPSSEQRPAGETVGKGIARKVRRESALPLKTGKDRRKAQGGERSSSSGDTIATSGEVIAGPGL